MDNQYCRFHVLQTSARGMYFVLRPWWLGTSIGKWIQVVAMDNTVWLPGALPSLLKLGTWTKMNVCSTRQRQIITTCIVCCDNLTLLVTTTLGVHRRCTNRLWWLRFWLKPEVWWPILTLWYRYSTPSSECCNNWFYILLYPLNYSRTIIIACFGQSRVAGFESFGGAPVVYKSFVKIKILVEVWGLLIDTGLVL